jgi:uncharacterized protein YdaU (DUF1376 family)
MSAMSDELWFRFFPSKFMAGIRGLNANEVKVYIALLCRMYERGGPIKNDAEILATYCELRPSSFAAALGRLIRLEKIFVTTDGRLYNTTAEQEISRRESYSEIAKRAGKKSAEKRLENQRPEATGVERALNHKEKRREEEEARARARVRGFEAGCWPTLLEIVGYPAGSTVPEWWSESLAYPHVEKWIADYGFTTADVLSIARAARHGHDRPLEGPKGLDSAMKAAFEARKHRDAKVPKSREEWLRFIAEMVNNPDQYVPQTMISNTTRRALIEAGLCTDEQLTSKGFR